MTGLKVDEAKIPANIQSFNCPKCKKPIPVTYVQPRPTEDDDAETVILAPPVAKDARIGRLRVLANEQTREQTIPLVEGVNIIGRKSASHKSATAIDTVDKLMSRSHIGIEVRKNADGEYNHYLYDNKSTNRTLYNNKYIEPGEIVTLNVGDEIRIGQTRLVFECK
jgi:pSer/pThr/pTyr-binding forkhead associated (FHA) protein